MGQDLGADLSGDIIGAAIEVHRILGPGLLDSVYEACLALELIERGHKVERQKRLPIIYKGKELKEEFRIDILVNDAVLLEIKSCSGILPIHEAQIMTYMKLSGVRLGLILNFNETVLKNGIKRKMIFDT